MSTPIPEPLQEEMRSAEKTLDRIQKAIDRLQAQAEGINGHMSARFSEVLGLKDGDTIDAKTMTYTKLAPKEDKP